MESCSCPAGSTTLGSQPEWPGLGLPDRATPGADLSARHPRGGAAGHPLPRAGSNLATSLKNLSNRLGHLGRREDGLTAIQESIQIRRRLAARWPAAYQADLEQSLQVQNWLQELDGASGDTKECPPQSSPRPGRHRARRHDRPQMSGSGCWTVGQATGLAESSGGPGRCTVRDRRRHLCFRTRTVGPPGTPAVIQAGHLATSQPDRRPTPE